MRTLMDLNVGDEVAVVNFTGKMVLSTVKVEKMYPMLGLCEIRLSGKLVTFDLKDGKR